MRERGDKAPIMMLTARGETRDRIEGFDSGADDYLPKPFDPDELLSRVRVMLRRSDAYRPSVLMFGDLTLDPGSGELSCGKERIRLSGQWKVSGRRSMRATGRRLAIPRPRRASASCVLITEKALNKFPTADSIRASKNAASQSFGKLRFNGFLPDTRWPSEESYPAQKAHPIPSARTRYPAVRRDCRPACHPP